MPGYGRTSRVQRSPIAASNLMRSALLGARVGIWLDDRCDCDRITGTELSSPPNFCACVFLMITWCKLIFGPNVAARWIDLRRVNPLCASKAGPKDFASGGRHERGSKVFGRPCANSWASATIRWRMCSFHSSSSCSAQALKMISY
jgi:hypothetical protein